MVRLGDGDASKGRVIHAARWKQMFAGIYESLHLNPAKAPRILEAAQRREADAQLRETPGVPQ